MKHLILTLLFVFGGVNMAYSQKEKIPPLPDFRSLYVFKNNPFHAAKKSMLSEVSRFETVIYSFQTDPSPRKISTYTTMIMFWRITMKDVLNTVKHDDFQYSFCVVWFRDIENILAHLELLICKEQLKIYRA